MPQKRIPPAAPLHKNLSRRPTHKSLKSTSCRQRLILQNSSSWQKNVTVIPNIIDPAKRVGVLTHEGIFGPLLYAEKMRAFFIELKPGMFLAEHPHDAESLVYTVSGKWVLCSEGKRQVMEAGSIFHFGSNMPTGWEAPFAEGALLMVVKSKKPTDGYKAFMQGLTKMKADLEKQRSKGELFYFNALRPDHPAVVFAKSVNPNFDALVKSIPY